MSDAKAAQLARALAGKVTVYANMGSVSEDGWEPFLALPNKDLERLRCAHVGWLLHTSLCITGSLGYLEMPVSTGQWVRASNTDIVEKGMSFRYVADMDPLRFVTYRDMFPLTKTLSVSSTGLTPLTDTSASGSQDGGSEHVVDSLPPREVLGDFPGSYVSSSPISKRKNDLRESLLRRDGTDVVLGLKEGGQAAHLVYAGNPFWLLDVIAETRGFAGGDSLDAWGVIQSMFDAPIGVLIWDAIHGAIERSTMGLLRVPNFGMTKLDTPRPESNLKSSNTSTETRPEDIRFPNPVPLSAEALCLHNLLPAGEILTWADTSSPSKVHVIPFTEDAETVLDHHRLDSQPCLRMPMTKGQADEWPLNAFFDWAWGARIAARFGTEAFKERSKTSKVSIAIEDYRNSLKKRTYSHSETDGPSKKRKMKEMDT